MPVNDLPSPSGIPLVSPGSDIVPAFPGNHNVNGDGNDKIQMKKQLGLLEGVAIILGIIFGSGKWKIWNCLKL